MPAYLKLYYACAIYFLLWAVSVSGWFIYNTVRYGAIDNYIVLVLLVACLVLAVAVVKGIVSIKAWQCYRRALQLTSRVRRLFVTIYYVTLLLGMGMLVLDIFVLPDSLRPDCYYGFTLSPSVVLLDGGIGLLTLACIYFAITDRLLLKAIDKKHEDNLISWGE